MINTTRPESLRLLRRTQRGQKATTHIENAPVHDNYLPVRTSLGITPADSLLYAPLTVVVEGVTEFCVPMILLKLGEAGAAGFQDVRPLLASAHFLDGRGDNYERMCRLAKSQGAKVILFLDGDKRRRVEQQKLREKHPDVAVVLLDPDMEIEQVVPKDIYFSALGRVIEEDAVETPEALAACFDAWEEAAGLPTRMMFTKRVERWLQDEFDGIGLDKARTMRRAVELVETGDIQAGPFRELVSHMRRLLDS
jgi:hypothetical protein